jgi:NADH dehydrogenase
VIGAGATGVELVSEMHDFIYDVLLAHSPQIRRDEIKIVLIEAANRILPGVDEKVVRTIEKKLGHKNIEVITGAPVTQVTQNSVKIGDREIPAYTKIWTAGVKANALSVNLPFEKDKAGRIKVNQYLLFSSVFLLIQPPTPLPLNKGGQRGLYKGDFSF